jgi:hypothetical protein
MISCSLKKKIRSPYVGGAQPGSFSAKTDCKSYTMVRFTRLIPAPSGTITIPCLASLTEKEVLFLPSPWRNLVWNLIIIFNPEPRKKLNWASIMRCCKNDRYHLSVLDVDLL